MNLLGQTFTIVIPKSIRIHPDKQNQLEQILTSGLQLTYDKHFTKDRSNLWIHLLIHFATHTLHNRLHSHRTLSRTYVTALVNLRGVAEEF